MKNIIVSLLAVLFISCSKKEEEKTKIKTYEKDQLTLSLPTGWKVKQDFTNKSGRFLELDKFHDSKIESTMGISIYNNKLSADSILADQIERLQYFYQKVSFKVPTKNEKAKLGDYESFHSSYIADDTQSVVYGDIYVFFIENKTTAIQIVEQEKNSNKSEFDIIFKGFSIK